MSHLLLAWYSHLSDVVPVEEGEGLGLHNGGDLVQGSDTWITHFYILIL